MEAFDVLVELSELDTRPRHRITSTAAPAQSRSTAAVAPLSREELAAARTLVRQTHELLRFSGSPWDSPFYRDPVQYIEQLTGALDRALACLEQVELDAEYAQPVAVYDRADAERA